MGQVIGGKGNSTSYLDKDFKNAYFENLRAGRSVANNLGVQQFAPRTGDYFAGAGLTRRTAGDGSLGMAHLNAGAALTAGNALTSSVDNLDTYINPYLTTVAGNTLADLNRAQSMSLNRLKGDAIAANAFGGARDGLVQTESERNFLDRTGRTLSDIFSSGFDKAIQASQSDLSRGLSAAQQLANLGVTQQTQGYQNAQALTNLGLTDQQYAQQALDAQRNLPLEQQALRNQVLALNPGGGSGMRSTSQQSSGLNSLFK